MIIRSLVKVVSTALLIVGASTALSEDRTLNSFRLVVHPDISTKIIDRRFLADAFLKKTTRWPDGTSIHPVDLKADSSIRRRFSQDVLGRSVVAVKSYWQQVIFSGRDLPPPELENEDEVLKYVLSRPGAVGYIASTTNVGTAKVMEVQ